MNRYLPDNGRANLSPEATVINRGGVRVGVGATMLAGAAVLAGVFPAAGDAVSQPKIPHRGPTQALCDGSVTLHLDPGLQLFRTTEGTNNSGSKAVVKQTGQLACTGLFEGAPITGPGQVGFKARYKGKCLATEGGGDWSFTLPVSDKRGKVQQIQRSGTYTGPSRLERSKKGLPQVTISFTGQYAGGPQHRAGTLSGQGEVQPLTPGGCVTRSLQTAVFRFIGLVLRG